MRICGKLRANPSNVRVISSSEYYDQLSPIYRQLAERRSAFLNGVDRLIVEGLAPSERKRSLLDIGGVDGIRAVNLARTIGVENITLVDNSPAMLARVERQNFEQILEVDVSSEDWLARLGKQRFDLALIFPNRLC